ncbi:MAG: response regulator [Bryobacteraceae bacterium]|nr:response regulator [Bryobacteraceae bacterium]
MPVLLHVDDNDSIRYARSRTLKSAGYTVVDLETGEEALEVATASAPDGILLDVRLPGMDGFATARTLRQNPRLVDAAIVLITSGAVTEISEIAANEETIDGFLVEPVPPQLLAITMAAALNRKRTQRELRIATAGLEKQLEETRRAAEQNERYRRTLEALMEYVPEGITIAELPELAITWVSKHGIELTGRPAELLHNLPGHQHAQTWGIFHADGTTPAENEELPLTRAATRGEVVEGEEWILRRPDGSRICCLCNAGPVRDWSGAITGGVIAWRDITDRKRRERALQQSNEELQQFVFSVSHDLQEPLRTVTAFGELLRRRHLESLGGEGDFLIQEMCGAAARMQHLIRDLLAFSQVLPESGRPVQEVNLNQVAGETIANLKAAIGESGADIELENLPVVRGDQHRLAQLLQNLLANAIKYARDGVQPRIRLTAVSGPSKWTICIQDNGPGIPPEHAERVFQPFTRLHGRDVSGTGLGLAIARRIVEGHGGRIWVEPSPQGGARFCFTLPVSRFAGD